jgi:hypothetical protein
MNEAVIRSATVAAWPIRPRGSGSLSLAFKRAILIALTTLACTACSNPQATRPDSRSDVSCVRSVETTGGSFLQAVAHCQKNPFNTFYPTMLDLSGAPDLQRQAFDNGYYNRDLPASDSAEVARLQTLQSRLTDAMAVRQKSQGKTVKQLSSTECMPYLLDVPHEAFALGPSWDGGKSPVNPYLTVQENDCVARQREAASGSMPKAAAAHSAENRQEGVESSTTGLVKTSTNRAHTSGAAHSVSTPTVMNKVFIL